jgi:hypothetical protein
MDNVTLTEPPLLTAAADATSDFHGFDISCHGGHNGVAEAYPVGGVSPYTYSWSPSAQTTKVATNLSATTYTVTIHDNNGCSTSAQVTPTEPPLLTTTAAPITNYNGYNVRCHGGSDGAAEAYPAGGVSPYTYSWTTVPVQTTKVANNLSATSYSVTVTDLNMCTANAQTSLTEPPQLTIDAGPNKTIYYGYPDSACTKLTATNMGGGVPPYVITWTPGGAHTNSITVCPNTTTVYTATITDANNCSFSDNVMVCVIDVRCGNNMDKVTLCHNTGSNNNPNNTLCVALPGAVNHIAHGDQLAACGTIKTCPPSIKMIINGSIQEGYLTAKPNPFTDFTTVNFRISLDEHVSLGLYDISGRLIRTLFNDEAKGKNEYTVKLDGSNLSGGMYFLTLKAESGEAYSTKLIITR